RMNIVVLDACRDNPFSDKSSGKGLAQLDAPPGTFLAYATAPGNVAEDGAGAANGLYTSFLLKELKKPQARIEDVFKRTRFGVRQASNGRQIPWESTSLEDDFFFDPQTRKLDKPKLGSREEDALFQIEKAAWDRIKDSGKAEDFFAFLQTFPSGFFSEQATFKLNVRAKPTLAVAPTKDQAAAGAVPVAAGNVERFRAGDRYTLVTKDGVSKAVTSRARFGVRAIQGDELIAEEPDGAFLADAMGGLIKDSSGTYDPPLAVLPAEFAIGKSWEGRTQWTNMYGLNTFSYRSRVTGREKITIAAGTFDAWVIETRAINQRSNMPTGANTSVIRVWAVPHVGLPLRMLFQVRNTGGLQRSDVLELAQIHAPR
ncbi:MAG: caspase domain-containing protein, partial [Methylibium sp.]